MPILQECIPLAEWYQVIEPLLKFDEFSKFYYNEYEPIKTHLPIGWILSEEEAYANACTMVDAETGMDIILLKRLPVSYIDALLVSHEIQHVILKATENSFNIRLRGNQPPIYEIIAQDIKSLLEDPIIDSFLQGKYNFDLLDYYLSELEIAIEEDFVDPQESSLDSFSISIGALVYAGNILKWNLIGDYNALDRWHKYQRLLDKSYPIISKQGKELASIVKDNGFDMLEKRIQLANNTIKKYNIEDILEVVKHQSMFSYPFWK